ncbi:hypothetical protein [Nocardia donostiensis]|uniref:Heavy metal-binding domain-containing protein n=1 Tax=Nocardia donostiensis TaxID=1538463 RepID=A0A1W0AZ33_9NOCA|nr:hypothetical protein [Nocardia donostiensis]ONM48848.1 hypothetical protein B0T46_10230 [Nocardia donostiensis]OQS15533.1 hypothetical protein B0T36_09820 [Nocardia donostiensis]OQS22897.1 hypothetical protein B0T44_04235 [Nocardia donostiensis]
MNTSNHDHSHHPSHGEHAGHETQHGHTGHAAAGHAGHGAPAFPEGLLITQDGYSLELQEPVAAAGEIDFRFRIIGPDQRPVTDYAPSHDRELHLIVAKRELTGFWHVHPERAADGTWSVRLNLPDAGSYRVFTDIAPRELGHSITLGADLAVAGTYAPEPIPAPARTTVVDDYEVELQGDLIAGAGRLLTLTVRKNGAPVTDLQPYLGAFGHLIILRSGDLAYVHVHPNGEPGDGITAPGPDITFHAVTPGPGVYRLFLDFQHEGVVHTAAFTLPAGTAHQH